MKAKPFRYLKHNGLTIYVDWSIPGELIIETWGKDQAVKSHVIKTPVPKLPRAKDTRGRGRGTRTLH